MEGLMPWSKFCALIQPHYCRGGQQTDRRWSSERMLRMYYAANWFIIIFIHAIKAEAALQD